MRYVVKTLALILLPLSMTACSNHMVYNLIQSSQRTQCYLLAEGQEQQCLATFEMTYGEYISARKEHGDLNYP